MVSVIKIERIECRECRKKMIENTSKTIKRYGDLVGQESPERNTSHPNYWRITGISQGRIRKTSLDTFDGYVLTVIGSVVDCVADLRKRGFDSYIESFNSVNLIPPGIQSIEYERDQKHLLAFRERLYCRYPSLRRCE